MSRTAVICGYTVDSAFSSVYHAFPWISTICSHYGGQSLIEFEESRSGGIGVVIPFADTRKPSSDPTVVMALLTGNPIHHLTDKELAFLDKKLLPYSMKWLQICSRTLQVCCCNISSTFVIIFVMTAMIVQVYQKDLPEIRSIHLCNQIQERKLSRARFPVLP